MSSADDRRLARASRLLRRQADLTQADMPSRNICQEIEAGRAGQLRLDVVRGHFASLGAKAQLTVWWNGAALERLFDARHASIVEAVARHLTASEFRTLTEYTFNEYGDRGSIDVFGGNDAARAVFLGEVKSEWCSLDESLRRHDMKRRLAPKLAEGAFGWRPVAVASVFVFPDESTARRHADGHRASLSSYPARARDIRAWLTRPLGNLGGIWFLSNAALVGHEKAEGL